MARKKWRRVKLLRRILRTTQHTRSANKTFLAPNSRTVRNPPLLKWRLGMYRILGVVYPRGGSPLVARLVWFQFYDQYRSWKKKKTYFINSLWNWSEAEREKKKKREKWKKYSYCGKPCEVFWVFNWIWIFEGLLLSKHDKLMWVRVVRI